MEKQRETISWLGLEWTRESDGSIVTDYCGMLFWALRTTTGKYRVDCVIHGWHATRYFASEAEVLPAIESTLEKLGFISERVS